MTKNISIYSKTWRRYLVQPMHLFQILLFSAASLLAAGCTAPTSSQQPKDRVPSSRPDAIYLYDFGLDLSKITASVPNADLLAFKQKLRESALRQLLEALNRAGIASYPFGRDLPPPRGNYWLVDATFYNIDETHALNLFLDKGRASHNSEAYVQISNLASSPPERVSLFETASQPSRAANIRLSAIDQDAGRIAGLIANHIVNYYHRQGWLVELPPGASGPAQPSASSQLLR
jgi:hypothetical protein